MYEENNVETYITIYKIDSQQELGGEGQETTAEEKAVTYAEVYRGFNFITTAMRSPWKVLNRLLVPGEMAKNGRGTTVELERPVRGLLK